MKCSIQENFNQSRFFVSFSAMEKEKKRSNYYELIIKSF